VKFASSLGFDSGSQRRTGVKNADICKSMKRVYAKKCNYHCSNYYHTKSSSNYHHDDCENVHGNSHKT
jgi:hypothetical protein